MITHLHLQCVTPSLRLCSGAKAYEKAEDPIYALENNLPIDVQHYLDHHLAQPLMRIFEPVCKDVKAELLSGEHMGPWGGDWVVSGLGMVRSDTYLLQ